MSSVKEDAEALLDKLLPFAEQMLQKRRGFFPFGGHMDLSGEIIMDAADDGTEQPPFQVYIDILTAAYRQEAKLGQLRACALFYDVKAIPPGRTEKQDAIAVAIDHSNENYSAIVVFPYSFGESGQLYVDEGFLVAGKKEIFDA